ncbi:MAG: hypothetical protein K0R19_3343 [Bacillota bacterium]|jgi:hypothetical protein|nr:hypothetical protein [Bacillota bacterium]
MEETYLKTKNDNKINRISSDRTVENRDSEAAIRQDFYNLPDQGYPDDEIDQMDNGFEFSQSEILDFAEGTDSYTDH